MKFIFLFFLTTSITFSQSEFIDSSVVGLGGGYTYAHNYNFTSSGYDFVITLFGSVDVGFQFSNGDADVEYSDHIKTSSNTVYIGYNFKKRENAINLKLLLGYYSGEISQSSLSSSGLVIGLGFYPRILNDKNFVFRILSELDYGFLTSSSGGNYFGDDDSKYIDMRTFALGLSMRVILTKNINLVFSPFISKDIIHSENKLSLGIDTRFVLGFEKNE